MISRQRLQKRNRMGRFASMRLHGWGWDEDSYEELNDPRMQGLLGTTRNPCSCWMCGNPRHHLKGKERFTLQERRHLEAWKELGV